MKKERWVKSGKKNSPVVALWVIATATTTTTTKPQLLF
jgi:hypothetical protein